MDSGLAATLVTVFGGGLVAIALKLINPRRANTDPDVAAADVVQQVASGHAATFGPEALVAMAQLLTTQGSRIGQLERNSGAYLARIAVVEHWGTWAEGPIPRQPPPWVDDPRLSVDN